MVLRCAIENYNTISLCSRRNLDEIEIIGLQLMKTRNVRYSHLAYQSKEVKSYELILVFLLSLGASSSHSLCLFVYKKFTKYNRVQPSRSCSYFKTIFACLSFSNCFRCHVCWYQSLDMLSINGRQFVPNFGSLAVSGFVEPCVHD